MSHVRACVAIVILVCLVTPSQSNQFTVTESQLQACKGRCCLSQPPVGESVTAWRPTPPSQTRIRRPIRLALADAEYLAKYKLAYQRLGERPGALAGQVAIHCAYCEGGSDYGESIHLHGLFFPWHRWYLYWHERLLQSLINDTSFSLPFWDWDNVDGRKVASEFEDNGSSLFRVRGGEAGESINTWVTHGSQSSMVARAVLDSHGAQDFFGGGSTRGRQFFPYLNSGGGEQSPATDPLFYAHHANIDRMWWLWKQGPSDANGRQRMEPISKSWLESSFVFYDEMGSLRRVWVRDAIDNIGLGYTYEDIANDWLPTQAAPSSVSEDLDADAEEGQVGGIEEAGEDSNQRQERSLVAELAWLQVPLSPTASEQVIRRRNRWLRWLRRRRRILPLPCSRDAPSKAPTAAVTRGARIRVQRASYPTPAPKAAAPGPDAAAPVPVEDIKFLMPFDRAPIEAPSNTGSFDVGPSPTTVRLGRILPEDRPGYLPVKGTTPGNMNSEALMIMDVDTHVTNPVFFNVFINNPNAVFRTPTSGQGWVGSWIWSPGLNRGSTSSERIAIVEFLQRSKLMDSTALNITIVPYAIGPDGLPEPVNAVAASVSDVYIAYE